MKEKRDCKIVQDLLPNYIEKLTNEETNQYMEGHLKECKDCKKILENMEKNFDIDTKREKREIIYIKKYSERLKILKLFIIIILTVALAIMTYYYFYFREGYINAANQMVEMVREGMYPEVFYATIEDIADSEVYGIKDIKIKGLAINDINHRENFYFSVPLDNLGDNFKIKWHDTDISFDQLKVGQTVAVCNYGSRLEEEPNCLTQVRMIIVLDDKL